MTFYQDLLDKLDIILKIFPSGRIGLGIEKLKEVYKEVKQQVNGG